MNVNRLLFEVNKIFWDEKLTERTLFEKCQKIY